MKFKVTKKIPRQYDSRIIKKFAWYPIVCSHRGAWDSQELTMTGEASWLETVYLFQKYDRNCIGFLSWQTRRFATKEEYESRGED